VHFHDDDIEADSQAENMLKKIAHNVGFKDVAFQYEPIAAAYAHEEHIDNENIAIIIDLGGGTSDFTVIRLSPERRGKVDRKDDILSTAGIRVGGTDFDKSLSLASFMPHLGMGSEYLSEFDKTKTLPVPTGVYHKLSEWPFIYQAQSPAAIRDTREILRTALDKDAIQRLLEIQTENLGHAVLGRVEQSKIALSEAHTHTSDLNSLSSGFCVQTNREDFLKAIDNLIIRIKNSMNECLDLAGCHADDINLVI